MRFMVFWTAHARELPETGTLVSEFFIHHPHNRFFMKDH